MAEAEGVETGHSIAMLNAQLGAAKLHKENLMRVLENWQSAQESQRKHELDKQKLEATNAKQTAKSAGA